MLIAPPPPPPQVSPRFGRGSERRGAVEEQFARRSADAGAVRIQRRPHERDGWVRRPRDEEKKSRGGSEEENHGAFRRGRKVVGVTVAGKSLLE